MMWTITLITVIYNSNSNSLYTLANNKFLLNSDLEDLNEANDWKSTNSHKGELVIAYNTKAGNNTLCPRVFYVLYIEPNDDGNGRLIYKLSTDYILVTMEYQSVPVPEDLIKTMNETDSSDNYIQINHFDSDQPVVRDYRSDNNNNNSLTPSNDKDNSEDGSHGELNSSQQLKYLKSKNIVNYEDQDILTKESSNSTSVSLSGLTSTNTILQGLFLQYLHETVIITKASIRLYTYYGHYNCLYECLYKNTFYVISTKTSLPLHTYYRLYTHLYKINSYGHLYLCLYRMMIYDHLYSYLWGVEFYNCLYYKVNLYLHLHSYLYEKYSYDVSTKISYGYIYTFKTWNTFTKHSGIYDYT